MKLMRVGERGAERPAVMREDGQVADVSQVVTDYDSRFFEGGGVDALRRLMDSGAELPLVDLAKTRTGACIPQPSNILCIGLNYSDHADEVGAEWPEEPIVFNKAPNTVIGPFDDVWMPRGDVQVDWEVELSVVIGKPARYLPSPEDAPAHIAGYCISNDVSERVAQLQRGGQWVKGKSFETFNPCGPWLVTPDELEPDDLDLSLSLNDEVVQSSSTKQMIFGVHYLVWYLSQFMVLDTGDLINTGTPAGVGLGMTPPRFLNAGDVMELTISGLGQQRQRCVPRPD